MEFWSENRVNVLFEETNFMLLLPFILSDETRKLESTNQQPEPRQQFSTFYL